MSNFPMPFDNPRTYPGHSGVDFPQNRGTPIRASGAGRVLRTPYTLAGGYWTTVVYDVGVTVGYAHQDAPVAVVRAGDRVREGQVIGYVGSLGKRSTGPHLHMEIIGAGTYEAVWRWFDRTRVVGAGSTAQTPAPVEKPAAVVPPFDPLEETMDPLYVYNRTPYDRVYVIHPLTGKKRALPKAEWEAAKLVGAKYWVADKAQVDEIPNG